MNSERFACIEGLRGWLCWIVVFSHITQATNIYALGLGHRLQIIGAGAVVTFMAVSGFVIAHLIIDKQERYPVYIFRRFMRIFPLFVVTCIAGYFTTKLYLAGLARMPWAAQINFSALPTFRDIVQSTDGFLPAHILTHLTMLHGLISSGVLPYSSYAFNAPAWSISLEWQFYLIAPAALIAMRRSPLILLLVIVLAAICYNAGIFGKYESPSSLLGSAAFFAIGIITRCLLPKFSGVLESPLPLLAILLMVSPFSSESPYEFGLFLWAFTVVGMSVPQSIIHGYMLENKPAVMFGRISYSIYLSHFIVLAGCLSIWLYFFPRTTKVAAFIGVGFMMVPVTVLIASLLFYLVEAPGIELAARITRRKPIMPLTQLG